ncbi:MAG: LptF/LptG family permease [Candidatus Wallbacteria bacterium]|nr:LptF/LptG family permease [Candidatus Wallbacteria bacterium]
MKPLRSYLLRIKILDRYLLTEILPPFLFGVFLFMAIFLIDIFMELTNMVINKGVSGFDVLKFFLYSLPALAVLVFPMGLLLGVVISLGRLSSDSEIVALKASGISFFRILMPLALFSIFMSCASFLINEFVVPYTNRERANLQRQILLKKPIPQIVEGEFKLSNNERALYAEKNQRGELGGVVMLEFQKGTFPILLCADTGRFEGDRFIFDDGYWYNFNRSGDFSSQVKFETMQRPLQMDLGDYKEGSKSPREMSFGDLKSKIREYQNMGLNTDSMAYELYMKTSLPFACLVFVLLGAPLSFVPSRNSKAIGTGLSIVIIFFYYILLSVGKACYLTKALTPLVGAWLPNIIVGIAGGILVWRARR